MFAKPEIWSEEIKDFLTKCLVKDQHERITSAELVNHPWVKDRLVEIERVGKLKETVYSDIRSLQYL